MRGDCPGLANNILGGGISYFLYCWRFDGYCFIKGILGCGITRYLLCYCSFSLCPKDRRSIWNVCWISLLVSFSHWCGASQSLKKKAICLNIFRCKFYIFSSTFFGVRRNAAAVSYLYRPILSL